MIAVDTSFLVALALREHPSHPGAWQLFEDDILGRTGTMAITTQVLAEFCHVVTDARRFEIPIEMTDAVELCEQWWGAGETYPISPDIETGIIFLSWMHEHRLGRKDLLDTLLAATYHRAGVERLATTNWRDFHRYGVFQLDLI